LTLKTWIPFEVDSDGMRPRPLRSPP